MSDDKDKVEKPGPGPVGVPASSVVPMHDKPISLEDILAAVQPNASAEYSRVPGFKLGQVFVLRSVTAGDIIEWSEANEGEAKRTAGLRLIVKSIVDGEPGKDPGAKGVLLMDEGALGTLRKLSHKDTERVIKAIIKLNGMQVQQDRAAKND